MTSKTSDFSTHQFGANFDTRKGKKQVGPKNQFKVGLPVEPHEAVAEVSKIENL